MLENQKATLHNEYYLQINHRFRFKDLDQTTVTTVSCATYCLENIIFNLSIGDQKLRLCHPTTHHGIST